MTITMVDELVPSRLWAIIAPLLPAPPRPPHGGRHRTIPDRNCFAAIVYMARTSTPWRLLPARELGCGSDSTVRRRFDEWVAAGVFEQLHAEILDRLGVAGRLTGRGQHGHHERARQARGTTLAQTRSTGASRGQSFTC
jgi:transposase